ncbi:MAG: sigma-54-dependent transcriptional regulator [Bdellovibrionales bacterium]
MTQAKTILIVDDEADIRTLIQHILEDEGYKTLTAANSKEAYDILKHETPDMAVLDIWLQDSRDDGIQILDTIKADHHSQIPVIMISGHGTIETAVNAIKKGAYDFIEKPFKSDRLLLMIKRGLEAASLQQENNQLKSLILDDIDFDIIGNSDNAKSLRGKIALLSRQNSRFLIHGSKGTGKTSIAHMIHKTSERQERPFNILTGSQPDLSKSDVNCLVNATCGGTLAIQAINLLPLNIQKHILHIIHDNNQDVRFIGILNSYNGLDDSLKERLNAETLTVEDLKQRKDDIPAIAEFLLNTISNNLGVSAPSISVEALSLLKDYELVGNYYELKAILTWAILYQINGEIIPSSLPSRTHIQSHDPHNVEMLFSSKDLLSDRFLDLSLRDARDVFEREYLTSQVDKFEGNISKTAEFVGMERSALHRKIKSLQEKQEQNGVTDKNSVIASNT